MYERPLEDIQHFYLWDKYLILDETRMNNFLISLSHSCMYGEIILGCWKGSLELRMRLFLLKVARNTCCASLWRLTKGDVDD